MPTLFMTAREPSWLRTCLLAMAGRSLIRTNAMIYEIYQAQTDIGSYSRFGATAALSLLKSIPAGTSDVVLRRLAAALELISRATLTFRRPAFGIDTVKIGNRDVMVTEEVIHATPFCSLLHFKKDEPIVQPRVLLVA